MTHAWGIGLARIDTDGTVLDTWFPAECIGTGQIPDDEPERVAQLEKTLAGPHPVTGTETKLVRISDADIDAPASDTIDTYLRLHLLSHRILTPREVGLEGIFATLPTIAWTSLGPVLPDALDAARLKARAQHTTLTVLSYDKFPRMLDYVSPSGVRVADADRVRLGAHLAEGTTVMHEGFVNFNAGTLGPSMVEGRISAGVVVGAHTDIGGGASIMGTLSGGGREQISIGENCLVGANAGVGISLGDGCVIEAGCYITAGAKITLADGSVAKASELSGWSGVLYRRNSVTGALEAHSSTSEWGGLRSDLHTHN